MEDVKSLEDSGLLLKGVCATMMLKTKKEDFLVC